MSRARNKAPPSGSDHDPSAPRAREPEPPADSNNVAPDDNAPSVGADERRNNASSASRDADYEVGYSRPPRQHQFKTGQSGNPRGRPKGVPSEIDMLTALLNKKIPVQERGRIRQVPVLEVAYRRVIQNAMQGDLKAMNFLINRMATVAQSRSGETPEMNEDDRAVLESFVAQVMNSHKNGGSK